MIGIQCRKGHVFSMIIESEADSPEWKLEEFYYLAQGCNIVREDYLRFSHPDGLCTHCESLEHELDNLIDKLKEKWIQEQF